MKLILKLILMKVFCYPGKCIFILVNGMFVI